MYEQIRSNVWKSYGLIFFFVLLIGGLGYLFSEVYNIHWILPAAVIFAVASSFGSYYYSDRIVLAMSKARPATREENAHLVNSVEGLAIAAGIAPPPVYIIDDSAPNAFATGRDPAHSAICVTTGLLEKLNRAELEGVIAHEMAHIKDYDIRLMTLVAVLAGTVVLMSDWMMRGMYFMGGDDRRERRSSSSSPLAFIILIVAVILAPLVATLTKLAISRKREYLADAQGALLSRYPEGLASALEKISADTEPLEAANKATAHMYIVNPLKDVKSSLNSLFSTHPPIEERVNRLRSM